MTEKLLGEGKIEGEVNREGERERQTDRGGQAIINKHRIEGETERMKE